MKKLLFICLMAVLTVACGSNSTKDKIVGDWQLSAVSGEELSESEKTTVIKFKADGTATSSNAEGDSKKWEIKQKDGKEFLVLGGEENEIKSIDDKKFVFLEGKDEITLSKK